MGIPGDRGEEEEPKPTEPTSSEGTGGGWHSEWQSGGWQSQWQQPGGWQQPQAP